jgi:hypothetical protein
VSKLGRNISIIGIAAACGLLSANAAAVDPTGAGQGAKKGLHRTAFVRGDASSKAKRYVAPRNEREALARRKVLANGIVVVELPEDRMVDLVAVQRDDGTIAIGHAEEGTDTSAIAKEAARE